MGVLDLLFKVQKIKKFHNKDFMGRKFRMTKYSKDKLLKEAYLFNEWYLPRKMSKKKLNEFKKKVKSKYEIISVFSNKDIQKIKKILIKNAH